MRLGVLLLLGACAHHPVPFTPRPDTRMVWGVHLDSATVSRTLDVLQSALPSEGALCYTGSVIDTLYALPDGTSVRAQLLDLRGVTAATQDSADLFHVYGPRCPGPIIAIGHSHPYSQDCNHSNDDARLLFTEKRALASLVWCLGTAQTLWQDGRRDDSRWRP